MSNVRQNLLLFNLSILPRLCFRTNDSFGDLEKEKDLLHDLHGHLILRFVFLGGVGYHLSTPPTSLEEKSM